MTPPKATGRHALLLLDLQEAICRIDGEIGRNGIGQQVVARRVLEKAAVALERARAGGFLVAFARLAFQEGYANLVSRAPRVEAMREAGIGQASSPGAAVCNEIAPRANELVVNKVGIDPLIGTPLLPILTAHGVSDVVIGGVATNHVVESAARHAADSGFAVTVLEDVCAGQTLELHRFAIAHTLPFYAQITTTEAYFAGAPGGFGGV